MADNERLMRRAHAAYIREGGTETPTDASGLETINEFRYVVLRNEHGAFAVFRYRDTGVLKRLRRWPTELETESATA